MNQLVLENHTEFIYYYLDGEYLGLLSLSKGELSDFRAVMLKNRLEHDPENLYPLLRTSLFALLNPFLIESKFHSVDGAQSVKSEIVKLNEEVLSKFSTNFK
jgi:hypothetical protein